MISQFAIVVIYSFKRNESSIGETGMKYLTYEVRLTRKGNVEKIQNG